MDTTQSRAATVTRSRWRFFIDSVRLNTSKKTKTTSALLIGSFSLFQISTSRPARAFAATLLFKAPLLLNHPPLSLPCLLLLILGATLQYFYLPTPPPHRSSSTALMFMKMILRRNASCMPRCHCLSSSAQSMCTSPVFVLRWTSGWVEPLSEPTDSLHS